MKHEITIDMEVKVTVQVEYDITTDWSADERGVFHMGYDLDITKAEVDYIQFPGDGGVIGSTICTVADLPVPVVQRHIEQYCFAELVAAWSQQES